MKPVENVGSVLVDLREPSAELRLLAAKLQDELKDRETRLSVDYFDDSIVIAYRGIIALYWRVADGELACFPTAWRGRTYTAGGAAEARQITIRLMFEFVRDFESGA